jgi:hypothetical protein
MIPSYSREVQKNGPARVEAGWTNSKKLLA